MSAGEIDAYLSSLDQPKRGTLQALRKTILAVIPQAEQGLAYGMPAFKLGGKAVCGFAAAKDHLSYFPHSGAVLSRLEADLAGYSTSKGTLRFPIDTPLPKALVRKLIAARLSELGAK
jgi:uncharacterized protein YdhG (YjbR/CyaY superfamily)